MAFLTVKQAAEKWGLKVRRVQDLCRKGMVPGVAQWGRCWMIPADADKPREGRTGTNAHTPFTPPYVPYILMLDSMSIPSGQADATVDSIADDQGKAQAMADLAYLRGNFSLAIERFHRTHWQDKTRIACLSIAQAAAISIGSYPLYTLVMQGLDEIADRYCDSTQVNALLKTSALIGRISMYCPPDELDLTLFRELPVQDKSFGLYLYIKYLHFNKKDDQICGIAEAFLMNSRTGHYTVTEIYIRVMFVVALLRLGKTEEAKHVLVETMGLALPDGLITPFAEILPMLGGMMEFCLEQNFPEWYTAIVNQCKVTQRHWLTLHNTFAKQQITTLLSLREYEVATMISDGKTNAEVAMHLHYSVSNVKKLVRIIFQKLLITRRGQVKAYVIAAKDV